MIRAEMKPKEIKIDVDEVFSKEERTAFLHLIADSLIRVRTARMHAGKTVDGRPFLTGGGLFKTTQRYSEGYEKRKTEHGSKVYDPHDRHTLTGEMLRAQTVSVSGDTALITFGAGKKEAKVLIPDAKPVKGSMKSGISGASATDKAVWNDRLRPFIAFTKAEIEKVVKEIIKEIRTKGRGKKGGK